MAEMDKTANFRGLPIFTQLLNLSEQVKNIKNPKGVRLKFGNANSSS
jgi:hypothetical protein